MAVLTTHQPDRTVEFWRVAKGFHMGDFVKGILDARHINRASMAKAMGVAPQSVTSYLNSKVIANEVLMRMSTALQFNIYQMVVDEQARLLAPSGTYRQYTGSHVGDELAHYGEERKVAPGSGFAITISPRDYSVEDMVKVLRFLDTIPVLPAVRKGA